MKLAIGMFLIILIFPPQAKAHKRTVFFKSKEVVPAQHVTQEQQEAGKTNGWNHPEKVTADFKDFPNLHPLVVHVPIMMLLLAAALEILGFFVFKEAISWIVLGFILIGFLGAYAAAVLTHPHVSNLPEHAQKVYDTHDMYAMWTLWLSGIAVLFKGGSHFLLKRAIWAEIIVALDLLGSAYTVSMAGHHGNQLVFIEGIGPQGKYLESGEHAH